MKERKGRGLKPEEIKVTKRQRDILKRIVRGKKNPQDLVRRVEIILAAANSETRNQHIADDLGTSRITVRKWRQRWLDAEEALEAMEEENDKDLEGHIIKVLADEYRSGTPPTFTAEQICQIMAVACEDPNESGRPINAWTSGELVDEAIKRGIVTTISERQVGRFLKGERSSPASMALLA